MAIFDDVSDEIVDVSLIEEISQAKDPTPPSDPPEFELMISLNFLTDFFVSQTLKLIGHIKHRKVIILVDSDNPHNLFIVALPKKSIAISVQSTIFKS
jgi:hypothetical protein